MRFHAGDALAMLSTLMLAPSALAAVTAYAAPFWLDQSPLMDETSAVKVPVTLGVMSRCPDALLCESVFDKVLPQVDGKVNLTLSFIGKIDESEPDFGVTCMHGAIECAGNVQELCAAKYLDQKLWWAYVKCLNFNGRGRVGDSDIALKCADTAKFDWIESGVGACAGEDGSGKGEEGVNLLQESVKQTKELGITKSCTVLINNKQVCIHDGSWKECEDGHAPEDFVRQINNEYDRLNMA
ncbi:hypothetical protein M0805_006971 [Coniferiporia weirii]|nr:hypothetical protein M0805_006971 [Coniferiporia weirii]